MELNLQLFLVIKRHMNSHTLYYRIAVKKVSKVTYMLSEINLSERKKAVKRPVFKNINLLY